MSDLLLEIGQNPRARRIIKTLGLPIPIPERLKRATGPWEERPLGDQDVVFGAFGDGPLAAVVAQTVTQAGANPLVVGAPAAMEPFRAPGEAFGRPARALRLDHDVRVRPDALIFDASAIDEPAQLHALYDFFRPLLPALARCGRVVVLGRPAEGQAPARAASQAALEGFTRSVAKEIGRTGATAQLLEIDVGAEARVPAVLRWLLSARSAFVTAQVVRVSARVRATDDGRFVRPLERQVALVTGAARGIGAATARLLAAEGAQVVCLDRPEDDGPTSQLAREIGGAPLPIDVASPEAPQAIADDLRRRFGGVDVVVHNAGVTRDKTLARMSETAWDQAIEVNLGAIVRVTEALLGGVLRDQGRIVCLSSVAGLAGNVGQTNYAASKAGVAGFVRALAPQLADRGIAVNAVAPGFIETRLTAAIPVAIREGGRRLSALGQGGQPEDVGQAVAFLASPGAAALCGQVLRVCGGAYLGS